MLVVKMRNDENVKLIIMKNKYSHFSYSSDVFTKIPKLGELYFINSAWNGVYWVNSVKMKWVRQVYF